MFGSYLLYNINVWYYVFLKLLWTGAATAENRNISLTTCYIYNIFPAIPCHQIDITVSYQKSNFTSQKQHREAGGFSK